MLLAAVALFLYSEHVLSRLLYEPFRPEALVSFRTAVLLVIGFIILLAAGAVWFVIRQHNEAVKRNLAIIKRGWKGGESVQAISVMQEGHLHQLQIELIGLINGHQRLYDSLHEEKEKLNALVSDISHQLATPITSIKLFAEQLDGGDEEIRMVKALIEGETERLEWLASGLKNISQLETGLIRIAKDRLPMDETIMDAINAVYLPAQERGMEIVSGGIVKSAVEHDRKWTKEAVVNILDNAMKYGDKASGIVIWTEQSPISYTIYIRDEGAGIPKEELPRVIKRFYRSPSVRHVQGAGLGLYLSYEIMEKQGGTMDIISEPGKGTTVKLIFFH